MTDTREIIDRISAEAVRLEHARDHFLNKTDDVSFQIRTDLSGRTHGLRWTLCLLKGWDPVHESGHEEKADQFIRVWHNLPGHCTEPGCGPW